MPILALSSMLCICRKLEYLRADVCSRNFRIQFPSPHWLRILLHSEEFFCQWQWLLINFNVIRNCIQKFVLGFPCLHMYVDELHRKAQLNKYYVDLFHPCQMKTSKLYLFTIFHNHPSPLS